MGKPKWAEEERFSTLAKRRTNLNAIDEMVGKWTLGHSVRKLVRLLQDAGVPSGVVQNAKDLANDPHLNARGFFVNMEHPLLGDTVSDRSPIMFTGEFKKKWKSAPLLGEDNRYVYMDLLGFSEDKFTSYVKKGIIS
jgi:crotonobetainyl-CoA:carnitine CoA-transferase CaiB-like acyl-CoA transferase